MTLRVICATLGLILSGYVLFSYEDTEKRMQNWFDKAWVSLADAQLTISSRINSFLQIILSGLNSIFVRMYGTKLISLKSFIVSLLLCLSLGVIIIGVIAFQAQGYWLAANVILGILLFFIPLITSERFLVPGFFGGIAVIAAVDAYLYFETDYVIYASIAFDFFGPWLIFGVIDSLAVATVRKLFTFAELSSNLRRTLLFMSLGIFCGPLYIAAIIVPYGEREYWDIPNNLALFYGSLAYGAWAFLTSFSIVLVVVSALLGRIFYVIAPRVIYAPIKLKLLENRKLMFSIGTALLGSAFPEYRQILEKLTKYLFA